MERLIDDTARDFLRISFSATYVFINNPTSNWMKEWDVATFIEALEEALEIDILAQVRDGWKSFIGCTTFRCEMTTWRHYETL